jgi:hypothetical protein
MDKKKISDEKIAESKAGAWECERGYREYKDEEKKTKERRSSK